jgi:SEC-C motif-containing protein
MPCPCGLDAAYADCCGSIHDGRTPAATAEQLMRSRYSAFAVRDPQYLLRSWYSATRPRELHLESDIEWTGLEILNTTAGTPFHAEGTVEFRANYIAEGEPGDQAENSHFLRENGQWVYAGPVS